MIINWCICITLIFVEKNGCSSHQSMYQVWGNKGRRASSVGRTRRRESESRGARCVGVQTGSNTTKPTVKRRLPSSGSTVRTTVKRCLPTSAPPKQGHSVTQSRNARNATPEGKLLKKTIGLHRMFYKGVKLGPVTTQRGEALVGCTRQQYRDLLASQFKPGMTHENNGHGSDKWQIDHIIPKARV